MLHLCFILEMSQSSCKITAKSHELFCWGTATIRFNKFI